MHPVFLPNGFSLPVLSRLAAGGTQKRVGSLLPHGTFVGNSPADLLGPSGSLAGTAAALLGGAAAVFPLLWQASPPGGGSGKVLRLRERTGQARHAAAFGLRRCLEHGCNTVAGAILHLRAAPAGNGYPRGLPHRIWTGRLPPGGRGQRQQPGESQLPGFPQLHWGDHAPGPLPVGGGSRTGQFLLQSAQGLFEKLCGQRLHRDQLGTPFPGRLGGAFPTASGGKAPGAHGSAAHRLLARDDHQLPSGGGKRRCQSPLHLRALRADGVQRGQR